MKLFGFSICAAQWSIVTFVATERARGMNGVISEGK